MGQALKRNFGACSTGNLMPGGGISLTIFDLNSRRHRNFQAILAKCAASVAVLSITTRSASRERYFDPVSHVMVELPLLLVTRSFHARHILPHFSV